MKIFTIVSSSILLCGNAFGAGLEVKEVKRDKPVDFQSEILPILRSNCLACHNRTRSKGDVILETPADIRKGNDDGSFVEPGNAKDSFIFTISKIRSDLANMGRQRSLCAVSWSRLHAALCAFASYRI